MISIKPRVLLLLLLLSVITSGSNAVIIVSADSVPTCHKIETPSVTRTWSDISLLYNDEFHDPDQVQEEIDRIHDLVPELVDMEVIGQSIQGRNITSLRITNELNNEQKAPTLVVAHHHGREQITVELALLFILRLLNNYGVDDDITDYINTEEIYIIPTLNPDALEVVVNDGNHWLRKNLRPYDNDGDSLFDEDPVDDENGDGHISGLDVYTKTGHEGEPVFQYTYYEGIDDDGDGLFNEDEIGLVDLNRNYGQFWGGEPGSSSDPTSQIYRGLSGFSEPETQAFRDFAERHRFTMSYALHSGINTTFFPSDRYGNWVNPSFFYQILQDYDSFLPSSFNEIYHASSSFDSKGSTRNLESGSCGMWDDWMYYSRNSILPITFEIYHNGTVDEEEFLINIIDNSTHLIQEWKGIYGYFNPVEEYIDDLWNDLIPAFDYLLEMTPRLNVSIESYSGGLYLGDDFTINFEMDCLSRRLGTTDFVEIQASNYTKIHSWTTITSTAILHDGITFPIPDLSSSNFTFRIGNNYTGYTRFVISTTNMTSNTTTTTTQLPDSPLVIVTGVAVVLIVLCVTIYYGYTKRKVV